MYLFMRRCRIEEATVRWVQFGALSAALRLHSTRSADLDRRPWTYGPLAEKAMRKAFHFRSELFPYLYSSVWQSHTESVPLTRPMYLDYPGDEASYQASEQYMLGDAILVAPVVSPGPIVFKYSLAERKGVLLMRAPFAWRVFSNPVSRALAGIVKNDSISLLNFIILSILQRCWNKIRSTCKYGIYYLIIFNTKIPLFT